MDNTVSDLATFPVSLWIVVGLLSAIGISTLLRFRVLPGVILHLLKSWLPNQIATILEEIISPFQGVINILLGLIIVDLILIIWRNYPLVHGIEFLLGLSLTISIIWLFSRIVKRFFEGYAIDIAFQSKRKVNSELLIVGQWTTNFLLIIVTILIFAQTHNINVVGLLASLGIGGFAIAFAAQNTLSQLFGGIVLYLDRPFVVDDYIGLPDGTFGQVESIGLRSTKIRISGKGTLMIVPNNALAQVSIENFTGAKKVMSLLYLIFEQTIEEQEQALIREIILQSTQDILGLNPRGTKVTFRYLNTPENRADQQPKTQAQVTLFILGSGKASMQIRRQLVDRARQNITVQLKKYGIKFEIEEPNIYIDSPITI